MASRVVPARSWTTERSSPTSRLNSVLLPTFGRPTMATRGGRGSSGDPRLVAGCRRRRRRRAHRRDRPGRRSTTTSSRSPARRPCSALTGYGSPRPSARNSHRSSSRRSLSALLATTSTSCSPRRSQSAIASSSSVIPTDAVDDEQHEVGAAHRGLDLAADLGLEVAAARHPAAGVDDAERHAEPLGLQLLAVAGDPRAVLDDRRLLADDAVEQRALADVGPADDGDDGQLDAMLVISRAPAQSARPSVATTSTGRGRSSTVAAVEEAAVVGQAHVGQQVAVTRPARRRAPE